MVSKETQFINNGISYLIVRSKKRSFSISMRIQNDLTVKVIAHPRMPFFVIKQLLASKEPWIKHHMALMEKRPKPKKHEIKEGGTIPYFGKDLLVRIIKSPDILLPKIQISDGAFIISIPSFFDEEKQKITIKKAIDKWFLSQGKKILTEKSVYYAQSIGQDFNELKIKNVSSIWGSCSRDQNLSFNKKLLYAPHEVVDYVVIHEVCHLIHKHHGKSFWVCVEKLDPEYKHHRKWLRTNSHALEVE